MTLQRPLFPPQPAPSWPSPSEAARRRAEQDAQRAAEELRKKIQQNEQKRGRTP